MMAAVFLAQPVGQLFSYVVFLIVLATFKSQGRFNECSRSERTQRCATAFNDAWRWVVGVGAIPSLAAFICRFFIPNLQLYDLEVKQKTKRNIQQTIAGTESIHERQSSDESNSFPMQSIEAQTASGQTKMPEQFSPADLHRFFVEEGNISYLFGTSICWFLLDFAFYGLGMGSPAVLSKLFASTDLQISNHSTLANTAKNPTWNTNPWGSGDIFKISLENSSRSIEVMSIASILGCLASLYVVDYRCRKRSLVWSFGILAVLFVVAGGIFGTVYKQIESHISELILVGICHWTFNVGTLVFPHALVFEFG
jgi:PHS family inorganic phosphate transporter-like MFS transporter